VKTPWFEQEIPFTKAASVGTQKVIRDHATIGIVVTTDGSIGELPRANYLSAEAKTIQELKNLGKPFIVLVNSSKPYSQEVRQIATQLSDTYGVIALPMNCQQMKGEDVRLILENLLYEFPVSVLEFYMPKWVEMLSNTHPFKAGLMDSIRQMTKDVYVMRDIIEHPITLINDNVKHCITEHIGMEDGVIRLILSLEDDCYYQMLSEWIGTDIKDEYGLLQLLKEYAEVFSRGKKCYYYIFSKSGFTDRLLECAEKESVKLLTLEDIYK
jgi:stage IV sporulation protein A